MESPQRAVRTVVAVVLVMSFGVVVEAVSVGTASAKSPTSCTTTITGTSGPITVNNGELVCLYRAVVTGTDSQHRAIVVNPGGGLIVSSSVIKGDIGSSGAFFLAVCATNLTGVVAASSTGAVVVGWRAQGCGGNQIGTTQLSALMDIEGTSGGAVIADANSFGPQSQNDARAHLNFNSGGVQVTQNTVAGSLDCHDNSPAPTGFGNSATAGKTGQCASL